MGGACPSSRTSATGAEQSAHERQVQCNHVMTRDAVHVRIQSGSLLQSEDTPQETETRAQLQMQMHSLMNTAHVAPSWAGHRWTGTGGVVGDQHGGQAQRDARAGRVQAVPQDGAQQDVESQRSKLLVSDKDQCVPPTPVRNVFFELLSWNNLLLSLPLFADGPSTVQVYSGRCIHWR